MNSEGNISLFLQLFKGREDCFAQQGEGWYFPVEKPLDEFYLRRHLEGDATFGVYVLNRQSRCHLLCIDVDIPKAELEDINFADRAITTADLSSTIGKRRQPLLPVREIRNVIPSRIVLDELQRMRGCQGFAWQHRRHEESRLRERQGRRFF